jgi:hypothetical protein
MSQDLTPLLENIVTLKAKSRIAQVRAQGAREELDAAIKELQATCPHETQKTTSEYEDSGYDYPASTYYETKCQVCGVTINKHTVTHPRAW